jgi:hypothetical protein
VRQEFRQTFGTHSKHFCWTVTHWPRSLYRAAAEYVAKKISGRRHIGMCGSNSDRFPVQILHTSAERWRHWSPSRFQNILWIRGRHLNAREKKCRHTYSIEFMYFTHIAVRWPREIPLQQTSLRVCSRTGIEFKEILRRNPAWPEVELRFNPWLLFFQIGNRWVRHELALLYVHIMSFSSYCQWMRKPTI